MKLRYKLTLNLFLIVFFLGITIITNKAFAATFLKGTICSLTTPVPNQAQLIKYQFTIPDNQSVNGVPFPPPLNWIEGLDIDEYGNYYSIMGHTQFGQASCIDNGTDTICTDNLNLYLDDYPNPSQVYGSLEIGYGGYPGGDWIISGPGGTPVSANGPTSGSGNTLSNLDTWPYPVCIGTSGSEDAPVTTATLSPTPNTDGTYPDPTTVTLSATAATGYTVANIYYTVDGGSQQTYSSPFTVTGSGNHTITYWSLDNNGVTEATNTKTFTISELVTAINAGGDTEGNFATDEDYSGGTTYSTSSTVDTSNVTNPALQAVYQTVRYGNFTYTVPNLTPNTDYTLRLYFNEVYFGANGNSGGVGSRVFNVLVNGTQALSNFDIYQAADGADKAVVEELPAISDSNGDITVQFSSVVDNAMVSGIEVDNGIPSTTPTPTPTPIQSEAINAGGGTEGSFQADMDSTNGSTYSTSTSIDTSGVTNPAPEAVYQAVRYGSNFSYNLTDFVPNSSHTVRLHFSEPYWGTSLSSNLGGVGSRVFNVSIDGTQVLNNFDVYQTAGGADKAVIEEFPVTADSNGEISIQFAAVTDNAMVSGIEVN